MEIVSNIKQAVKIEEHYGIAQDISQELAHGHFGFILESAKHLYTMGKRDVLLKLTQQCFQLGYFKEGLGALDTLEESDKVGHFEAAHLILSEKVMSEKGIDRFGLALRHLFKSGNDPIVQKLRDKVFAFLTGANESQDTVPTVTGIRLNDAGVVVRILAEIKQLNEKKKSLQMQEKALQAELQKGNGASTD
jgi:hypothetical protein